MVTLSLFTNSKYTFSANIVNQLFGMLIFLSIPNILSPTDYAQTIYISVLLSFSILAEFGMNFIYGRTMPAIYHKADHKKIDEYNQTFFWFRFLMSIIGSIIISTIYYLKYPNLFNSILLITLLPVSFIVTFHISQYSVKSDFLVYRNINIKNAAARLILIPLSSIMGIGGWIIAQTVSSLIILSTIKEKIIMRRDNLNFSLIKYHFFEGLILLANFFFWNQLLNSGRLYASMYYDEYAIAQYGLTNTGYTILQTLIISIFLPVTIETLKIMQDNPKNAIEQIFNAIIKTSLIVFIIVIVSIEVAPYLFEFFFPKYNINFDVLKYQLLSLIALPIVSTLGNIFVGLKQPIKLMIIYGISFAVSFLIMHLLSFGILNAAIAQFIGILFMGILLLGSTFYFFPQYIENKIYKLFLLFVVVFFPYIIYLNIRSFFI